VSIRHHVSDDLLLSYAAGNLDEASSLLVATHLAMCPHCRSRARMAEAVGGVMLEGAGEAPVAPGMFADVLAAARKAAPVAEAVAAPVPAVHSEIVLPEPLRSYLGGDLAGLQWKRVAPKVDQILIETEDRRSRARLLRFGPGTRVPTHSHDGRELTLVLTGSLHDGKEVLFRGDIAESDERTEHDPHAGPDCDCICLAVTDAPLRFKSVFARLLQPLFGI
jgi:putative transcriptional regulator